MGTVPSDDEVQLVSHFVGSVSLLDAVVWCSGSEEAGQSRSHQERRAFDAHLVLKSKITASHFRLAVYFFKETTNG